ncbi:MAG: Arm DNA-binding domain-containing protein, partial [Gammaproteobacteria bacterium]|nr:Arm DNA-binding domain-containing protein [Gammaproteobacteria bacterium]
MLTDTAIKALKPVGKDQWVCDGNGLYLRVRKTGGKSWVLRRKRQGHTRIITLGKYPNLRLKDARLKAAQLGSENTWSKLTLRELLDEWYEDQIRHQYKRPRPIRLYLDRVSPDLLAQKIREIIRADVRSFLKKYSNERGPVGANRL